MQDWTLRHLSSHRQSAPPRRAEAHVALHTQVLQMHILDLGTPPCGRRVSSIRKPAGISLGDPSLAFHVLSLVLLGISLFPVRAVALSDAQAAQVPRFEPGDCSFHIPGNVEEGVDASCGYLVVSERHDQPDGPTLRLALLILKALDPTPSSHPLVVLHGGPGGSAIADMALLFTDSPIRYMRDVILLDQRGAGHSEPRLDCPELMDYWFGESDSEPTEEQSEALYSEAIASCRYRLTSSGIDLLSYTTDESAADIEDLRNALGYRDISVYGVSYGAELALAVMENYPDSVHAVILDSPVPRHFQFAITTDLALNELIASCLSTPECADAYPDLAVELPLVISRLDQRPVEVHADRPGTDENTIWSVDGDYFSDLIANSLRDTYLLPLIPMLIHETASGRHALVELPLQLAIEMVDSTSFGTSYSVQCLSTAHNFTAGYAGPETGGMDFAAVAADEGAASDDCTEWRTGMPLASLERAPDATGIPSNIPTLVLSGRFDPLVRPGYGNWIAQQLGSAQALTLGNAGHGVIGSSECADTVMAEFLERPGEDLDPSCIREVSEIDFVTEADIVRLPLAELGLGISQRSPLALAMLGAIALSWAVLSIGSVLTPAVLLARWMMRRLRGERQPDHLEVAKRRSPPRIARSVPLVNLTAAVLLSMAFLLAVSVMVAEGYEGNLSVLFGLPRYAAWTIVMSWMAAFFGILGSGGTVLGLFGAEWSKLRKIAQSTISVGTLLILCALVAVAVWARL